MKKQKAIRKYNLTDAELILKGKEKISFFRRDKDAFTGFRIWETTSAAKYNDYIIYGRAVWG